MSWPETRPSLLFDEDGQTYHVLSAREARAEIWSGVARAIEDYERNRNAETLRVEQVEYRSQ